MKWKFKGQPIHGSWP